MLHLLRFLNFDGFVKSPYAALPFFPRHCGVPSVRFIPRDSGALPLELFALPFEKVLNCPFYDFITFPTKKPHPFRSAAFSEIKKPRAFGARGSCSAISP